nr:hypothetical protein OH826_16365 [Streptomyces sp. NBC_00899]
MNSKIAQLKDLGDLRTQGVLTDAEFGRRRRGFPPPDHPSPAAPS